MSLVVELIFAITTSLSHCTEVSQNGTSALSTVETQNWSTVCLNGSNCVLLKQGRNNISGMSASFAAMRPLFTYSLFVILMIPFTLFPIVYLFTRNEPVTDEPEDDEPDGLEHLSERITFLPTLPAYDVFIADPTVWGPDDDRVVVVNRHGQAHYSLQPSTALLRPLTGQLYHPQSGLVFNPIRNCVFEPSSGLVINTKNSSRLPAHPNLVYRCGTDNKVFERCLAMSFRLSPEGDSGVWQLARSPACTSEGRPLQMDHVRRIRVEELPKTFAKRYAQLLAEWQAHAKRLRRMSFIERMQPGTLKTSRI